MTRQTSIEVYNQIKEEGLLPKMRLAVFYAVVLSEPCTSTEAMQHIKGRTLGFGSRFTELRRAGVIEELGTRECKITGRNVIEWGVTGSLPVAIPSKEYKPPKRAIQYIINKMEENNMLFVSKPWLEELIKK